MKIITKHGDNLCFILIVIALALTPILSGAGIIQNTSTVLFLGKCIAFSIVAIGLDLIWGYTGILSLGHGLYFGLGAYVMAMYLKLQETGGNITDFMHVGGLKKLPLIWQMCKPLGMSLVLVIVVPGVVAGIIGYFIFKSRVKGVYFSIISQAITWAAY